MDEKESGLTITESLAAMRTPEFYEKMRESLEQCAVPSDGLCRTSSCRGRITARVCSLFRFQYGIDTPRCSVCGREYSLGGKQYALVVGYEEWRQMMYQPVTI